MSDEAVAVSEDEAAIKKVEEEMVKELNQLPLTIDEMRSILHRAIQPPITFGEAQKVADLLDKLYGERGWEFVNNTEPVASDPWAQIAFTAYRKPISENDKETVTVSASKFMKQPKPGDSFRVNLTVTSAMDFDIKTPKPLPKTEEVAAEENESNS